MISKILQIRFSRSIEHFFLTVGQDNFGRKIPNSILAMFISLALSKVKDKLPKIFFSLYQIGIGKTHKYIVEL